jgi:PAS domain S-box-containing protein
MTQYNYIYRSSEDLDKYVRTHKINTHASNVLIQMFTSLQEKDAIEKIACDIVEKFPNATLIGSSTAGEIVEGKMLEEGTVLSISLFEKSRVKGFLAKEKDSFTLGFSLAKALFTSKTKCVISFLDGLLHNGQEYLDGLSSLNANKAVIAGGMAADGLRFQKTYTILGTEVFSGGAVCATIEGDDLVAYEEYNLGWKAVGPTFTITKSEGARVYEINNRPVKEVYAEVLGDLAVENMPASTIEFPLIHQEGELLVARSMLWVFDDGSILYGGDLEEGEEVRFGIGSRTLVNKFTLQDHLQEKQESLQACFIYSCIARKQFLGKELQKSFRLINSIAPSSGFFTYGEFFANEDRVKLLNVTTTMLFLKERDTQKQKRSQALAMMDASPSKTDSALFNLIDYVTKELRVQEQEFRASKFQLDEFLKALDSTVIISRTDTEGIITYVNDRFVEISGYSKEELLGKPHSIVRHPSVSKEVFADMWREIKRGNIWRGEIANRAKDGGTYYVKSSIIPIHDEKSNIIEYMAIREDVTSLVESRKKAQEAEAAQAQFLANMSHEIRTPMNGILGFSELLAKTSLDAKQEKYVNVIASSTKLLLNIVNDILDSSKLASNKITLEKQAIDLISESSSTFELLESMAKEKELDYRFEIDAEIWPCVLSDALRLRQVVTNLLSNAIKFTPEGGSVTFSMRLLRKKKTSQEVYFCIEDTGIGIAKEKLKTIFEPFSQADSSTTRKFGGTGLGLSISSELLKAFGSKLEVESTQGEGSRFFFRIGFETCVKEQLKAIEPTDKRICSNNSAKNSVLVLKVLVVEDYDVNRLLITSLFEKYEGIRIRFAQNGQEALNILNEESFDLIFMDINMPVMNGMDATKIIRTQMHLKTPIIALTANVIEGDKERYLSYGMDGYLSKPIDVEALEKILCRYGSIKQKDAGQKLDVEKQYVKINEKLGLSRDTAQRLLETFLQSVTETLPLLKEACKEQNLQEIYEYAHRIKGAAGSLFIDEVYEAMVKIESQAQQNSMPNCDELEKIEAYVQSLQEAIIRV